MSQLHQGLILVLLIFLPSVCQGQGFIEDILELLEIPLNKKAVAEDSTRYPAKLVVSPVVAFEPATNWGAGVGAKILFKFKGSGPETRTSNLPISALYTLNNQILLQSGYTIFFNQEKWYLEGNLGFSKFPQAYFGIGNLTEEENEETFSFTNYLIEPLLLKRVYKKLFIGGGIRYNIIANTELEEEGDLIREMPTGFDGSNSAGLEVAAVWDNRDNVLNASRGNFIEFKQGFYEEAVGGTHQFRFNQLDARTYIKPWKRKDDVIAFHLFGRFSWGDVPVGELSLLGGVESARGYQEGRFRDRHTISSQVEYRLPIWDRIGMVFFAEAGDVFRNTDDLDWEKIKYGAGLGLRLKIVKSENLNIRFDYGFGFGRSNDFVGNYYLGIAEAF